MNTLKSVITGVSSKCITFLFNVLILRLIDKENYGISRLYFDFLFHLIMFFPRETMRKTCQKYSSHKESLIEEERFYECSKLNGLITYLTTIASMLILSLVLYLHPNLSPYTPHLFLYFLSAILELFVDPVILYTNLKFDSKHKIYALIISNYFKVITNFIYAYLGMDLWSFSLSRLTASLFYCTYLLHISIFDFKLKLDQFFPSFKYLFSISKELKEVFFSFVQNSILKMIIANTEKFLLGFFLVFSDVAKAEFSFVVDNFSIISRMLLEPIEENFFNLISKLKSSGDEKINNEHRIGLLEKAVRIMIIFGSLIFIYVFLVGRNSIQFVYTDKWATDNSIKIIKFYAFYLGLTAINGILESFTNATVSEKNMIIFSKSLILNSLLMVILCLALAKQEITGLIVANIICVIIRIIINLMLSLAENHKESKSTVFNNVSEILKKITKFLYDSFFHFQSVISILIAILCISALKSIESIFTRNFLFLVMSGIVFVLNCIAIYFFEKRDFREFIRLYKEKSK